MDERSIDGPMNRLVHHSPKAVCDVIEHSHRPTPNESTCHVVWPRKKGGTGFSNTIGPLSARLYINVESV